MKATTKKNKMQTIKHLFHINSSIESVFEALTDVKKLKCWYTSEITGSAKKGGEIVFRFGEISFTAKVTKFIHNEALEWKTVDASIPLVNHIMAFHLDTNADKTRVRFEHVGFESQDDGYANMNYSWAKYLESLRQYCQKGIGEGFGTTHYRS